MTLRYRHPIGVLLLAVAAWLLTSCQHAQPLAQGLPDNKLTQRIAMVVAFQGYDTTEFWEPRKIFEQQGMQVTVVSSQAGEAISGGGVAVPVDLVIDRLKAKDFDAIVFVGGSGSGLFYHHKMAHTIARDAVAQDKVLAAICAGTSTLAHSGVLKGKRATGYYKEPIVSNGGIYGKEFVITDGKIVTAIGPNVVKEFARAVLAAMQ